MESGGESSEGIVASSDDELDGLSEAVEYHIFSQEAGPPGSGWSQQQRVYDYNHEPPQLLDKPRLVESSRTYYHHDDPRLYKSDIRRMPPSRLHLKHLDVPHQTHQRDSIESAPRPSSPPLRSWHSSRYYDSFDHNPSHSIPKRYADRRQPPKDPHYPHRPQQSPYSPPPFEMDHPLGHKYHDTDYRMRVNYKESGYRHHPDFARDPPIPHPTRHRPEFAMHPYSYDDPISYPMPAPVHCNERHALHENSQGYFPKALNSPESLSYKSSKIPDNTRRLKGSPKPVSFKVKQNPTENNINHRLDPLVPPLKLGQDSSPEIWAQDMYHEKQNSSVHREERPDKLSKRSHQQKADTKGDEGGVQNEMAHVTESPDGLIHAEKNVENTIYEEEEVVIQSVSGSSERNLDVHNSSSDQDEELLGLRLKALTSALKKEKPKSVRKKTSVRKKKVKNLIHKVRQSPEKLPRHPSIHRKSRLTDSFMGRYSTISKRYSPQRPRSTQYKPTPTLSQLTLIGELARNHPPEVKKLRKIRKKEKVKNDKKQDLNKIEDNNDTLVDNYDEMEMDLDDEEIDDGDNDDINLVPPGTDPNEVEPPLPKPKTPPPLIKSNALKNQVNNPQPLQESNLIMPEQNVPSHDTEFKAGVTVERIKITARRESSEDVEDEDAILKLRQSLLMQLQRNGKALKDSEIGITGNVPVVDAPAPLTSQFPYKAPELNFRRSVGVPAAPNVSKNLTPIPLVTTTIHSVVAALSSSVSEPNASDKNSVITTVAAMASTAPVSSVSPAPVVTLNADEGLASATPKKFSDSITNVENSKISSITPQSFVPLNSSTPAVTSSQTPLSIMGPSTRRRRIQKKRIAQNGPRNITQVQSNIINQPKDNILKPVTNVEKQTRQPPKTLVKTATTIIKSTASNKKRPISHDSPSNPSKKLAISSGKTVAEKPLLLPRHQPVVVNIGSSDEEDSVLSSEGKSFSSGPMQMEWNTLNEMIRKVRNETTAIQNADKKKIPEVKKLVDADNEQLKQVTSKGPKLRAQPVKHVNNSNEQQMKIFKHDRARFLKLKSLIQKDEIKFNRLAKVKEAKKSELKVVEDELKEMMFRVAAIKGKNARCLELVKRYNQQEVKIKRRLMKRNAMKVDLEKKLGEQLIKLKEMKVAAKLRADANTKSLSIKNSSAPGSPMAKVPVNATKLSQEKQRLLAKEQALVARINKMKKTDGPPSSVKTRRNSSLSKEVQSNLDKYRNTLHIQNPSAHDLSLNKITISVSSPKKVEQKTHDRIAPVAASSNQGKGSPDKEKMSKGVITEEPQKMKLGESVLNMRKMVRNSYVNYRPFEDFTSGFSFEDVPFTSKFWEKKIPVALKSLKLDAADVPASRKESKEQLASDLAYQSPLRMFRSYRLNPFMRVKEKFSIKSPTFSHKINPRQIMCRYELTGTCQDPDCNGQHGKQYQVTPDELILDLLLYCPTLLDGYIPKQTNYETMIAMVDATADKLLGSVSANISVEDKCILIISKVNSTLGNKPPFYTVLRPRSMRLKQREEHGFPPIALLQDEVIDEKNPRQCDSPLSQEERYFPSDNDVAIQNLEEAVKRNPADVQLWIELIDMMLEKDRPDKLDFALHTICLALEENPYSGVLWTRYLSMLHDRNSAESAGDLDEMVDQALNLVPLSTEVWDQLLSWKSDVVKMEAYLDILISNLVKVIQVPVTTNEFSQHFMSKWLLETLLRKVHLSLQTNEFEDALTQFSEIMRRTGDCDSFAQCLLPSDFNSLWLSYINVKHFKCLPQCFTPDIRYASDKIFVQAVRVTQTMNVQLHFSNSIKMKKELLDSLIEDLNFAIDDCKIGEEPNTACLNLLKEKLRVLKTHQCWSDAIITCRLICKSVQESLTQEGMQFGMSITSLKRAFSETMVLLADSLAKDGSVSEATQSLEDVINENSMDAKLCFEAALLQLSVDSNDLDAVLVYIEACMTSYLVSDDNFMDSDKLKLMLKYVLKQPLPLDYKVPSLADGVTWEIINGDKVHLWLLYCLLLQLSNASDSEISEQYERAIEDVEDLEGKKELCLRYLRFKQGHVSAINGSGPRLLRAKQLWMKSFSALTKRFLTIISPAVPDDERFTEIRYSDYSFHNLLASIYLSCFHTRQQITTAYHFLTEVMPYNVPLLLRACKFFLRFNDRQVFLRFNDHHSVISTLWKVTANVRCQNDTLWKICVSSHFSIGRIAKALHLAKQSVEAIPFSVPLWSDYLTLLKAYGRPEDFIAEKVRCSNILQVDATGFVKET